MASAVVTVKMTPGDLQYINAALQFYVAEMRHMRNPEEFEKAKPDLSLADGDPLKAHLRAAEIIGSLGLR